MVECQVVESLYQPMKDQFYMTPDQSRTLKMRDRKALKLEGKSGPI